MGCGCSASWKSRRSGPSRPSRIPRKKPPKANREKSCGLSAGLACPSLRSERLRCVFLCEAELALEHPLRHRADGGRGGLAVLEEHDQWDRRDAVADREFLLVVDVDLYELELVPALLDDAVEHGLDGVARPAPLGPEVHDHGPFAVEDLLLEGLAGHVGCHSVPFEFLLLTSTKGRLSAF